MCWEGQRALLASVLEADWGLVASDAVCVGPSVPSTWPGRLVVSQQEADERPHLETAFSEEQEYWKKFFLSLSTSLHISPWPCPHFHMISLADVPTQRDLSTKPLFSPVTSPASWSASFGHRRTQFGDMDERRMDEVMAPCSRIGKQYLHLWLELHPSNVWTQSHYCLPCSYQEFGPWEQAYQWLL